MQDPNNPMILCAVEGIVDEAVARCVVREVGANPEAVYGKKGKAHLRGRLSCYNQAAEYNNWFVLIDLDQDAVCIQLVSGFYDSPLPQECACELQSGRSNPGFLPTRKSSPVS